jgi:hypothetical protein
LLLPEELHYDLLVALQVFYLSFHFPDGLTAVSEAQTFAILAKHSIFVGLWLLLHVVAVVRSNSSAGHGALTFL